MGSVTCSKLYLFVHYMKIETEAAEAERCAIRSPRRRRLPLRRRTHARTYARTRIAEYDRHSVVRPGALHRRPENVAFPSILKLAYREPRVESRAPVDSFELKLTVCLYVGFFTHHKAYRTELVEAPRQASLAGLETCCVRTSLVPRGAPGALVARIHVAGQASAWWKKGARAEESTR